jgi:ubiquinone biosynthesis protein
VYKARLAESGELVAVKVRRPGIEAVVHSDLEILRIYCWFVDTLGIVGALDVRGAATEVRMIMEEELSYRGEALAAADFRKATKRSKHIVVPRVHFSYSTDSVLVCEFLEGTSMRTFVAALEDQDYATLGPIFASGTDRKVIARRLFKYHLRQLYEGEVVHSDPHPANIILLPGNRIGIIDFGAVAYFTPRYRARIDRVLRAIASRDSDEIIDAMIATWEPLPRVNLQKFRTLCRPVVQQSLRLIDSKHATPPERSAGRMFSGISRVAGELGIYPPAEHMRLVRLTWEFDNLVVTLDPEFDTSKAIRAYFRQRARRRAKKELKWKRIKATAGAMAIDLLDASTGLASIGYRISESLRKVDHTYAESLSKGAAVGMLFLRQLEALALAACGIVVYKWIQSAHVPELADGWRGWPWWAWAAISANALFVLERIRVRIARVEA